MESEDRSRSDNKSNINLNDIFTKSLLKYSPRLILSGGMQSGVVWLSDVYFYERIGKITVNLKNFLDNPATRIDDVLYLVGIYFTAEVLDYANNKLIACTIPDMELQIIEDVIDKTFESVRSAKSGQGGELINVNEYIMNIRKLTELRIIHSFFITTVIPVFVIMIGILWQFRKTGRFVMYLAMAMVLLILLTIYFEYKDIETSKNSDSNYNIFFDKIQDIINNLDTVVSNGTYEHEKNRVHLQRDLMVKIKSSNDISISKTYFYLNMSCFAFLSFVIYISLDAYDKNSMEPDTIFAVYLMTIALIKKYNALIAKFRWVSDKLGKIHEVEDYFKKYDIIETINSDLKVTKGDISIKNLTIKYKSKTAVDNVSFNIPGGKITGIIGDVGSGKSSIIKAIVGLVPYTGTIEIDSQLLKESTNITYVPQHPRLFDESLLYNVSYGTELETDQILSIINAENLNFFKAFPKGVYTRVGKEGSRLSGGQKQMIALIRALIQSKKIVLMDEPTSSLDIETKKQIMNLIKTINKRGATVVIVTHDHVLTEIFDSTINLSELKNK